VVRLEERLAESFLMSLGSFIDLKKGFGIIYLNHTRQSETTDTARISSLRVVCMRISLNKNEFDHNSEENRAYKTIDIRLAYYDLQSYDDSNSLWIEVRFSQYKTRVILFSPVRSLVQIHLRFPFVR
jgi:hypothetical protein